MHKRSFLSVVILFLCLGSISAQQPQPDEARLLRFPAIQGNQIVFTYAGDLYSVPATGGVARKLTNHEGFEMFAHFSPDGKWLLLIFNSISCNEWHAISLDLPS
jgi:tricorn protease